MITRRQFVGTAVLAGVAGLTKNRLLAQVLDRPQPSYFGLHPFIEANPKAVFIRRTSVSHKMDSAAKLREGLSLASEIFQLQGQPGIPITHRIILKPNVCSVHSKRPLVETFGTGTDPDFYEGIVLGLK